VAEDELCLAVMFSALAEWVVFQHAFTVSWTWAEKAEKSDDYRLNQQLKESHL
jgi:hypothetical protein